MKIVERQVGDVVILDLHGKILIGEGDDALREAVTRLLENEGFQVLVHHRLPPNDGCIALGQIMVAYYQTQSTIHNAQ